MATTPAPTGESCGVCSYFFSANKDASLGHCFRFPPSAVYNPKALSVEDQVVTQHPDVVADDWCGEYSPAASGNSPA